MASAKSILSYFPIRYFAAAVFLFFVLLNSAELINNAQERLVLELLTFFNIPSHLASANLYVGEVPADAKVTLPTYLQLLFMGFFPIMAITARTNFSMRLKLFGFGILCFLMFVVVSFSAILSMYLLDVLQSNLTVRMVTLGASIVAGSMMIELGLFSTITFPRPTRIQRAIKRKYGVEYAILLALLVFAGILVYAVVSYIRIDIHSPIMDYVLLIIWLSMSSMITFAFFMANLAFEARRRFRLRTLESAPLRGHNGNDVIKTPKKRGDSNNQPDGWPSLFSVSFLIPAYNEEGLVGKCIESIDGAASNYSGEVQIVVINDGSTDNTEKVVGDAFKKLRHCSGNIFTIPNSGKGYALALGLQKTSGEIIFRTDADSEIDENALEPMMRHFKDPAVGSVCGWVFPLREGEGLMWRVQNLLCAYYLYTKRGQDVVDSIITQPGSSTAFRREAIMKAGGFADNIFGEDGEITNRIARMGYRGIFEGNSVVYSEHPTTLIGFIQQRARWGVAFFHSRGRNLRLLGEFRTPRSFVFFWNLLNHGAGLAKSLIWPFLAVSAVTGFLNLTSIDELSALTDLSVKLVAIQASIVVTQLAFYAYRLRKVHRLADLKFYPFIRFVNFLINVVVKPQVIDVLLHWSTKWKKYDTESFKELRREVNKSIDPLYPSGDQSVPRTVVQKEKNS